jgi:hypothetical protein
MARWSRRIFVCLTWRLVLTAQLMDPWTKPAARHRRILYVTRSRERGGDFMTLPVTADVLPVDHGDAVRPVLVLLRRVLVMVGGLVALGILGIVLAGNANAQTPSSTSSSPGNGPSRVDSASPSGLDGDTGLTAPLAPSLHTVTASVAPVVNPVLGEATTVLAPVVTPVLAPVSATLAPPLHAVSAVLAPILQPVVEATGPVLRPATGDLGLAPVVSAIGGSDAAVGTIPAHTGGSPAGEPTSEPVSLSAVPVGPLAVAAHATTGSGPTRATATTVDPLRKTVAARFSAEPWPGQVPGSPGRSLPLMFGVSVGTSSSAGSGFGGGHGPASGIADAVPTALGRALHSATASTGVRTPQPGYVHGRDHPS